jgi:hypothetical protein
VIAPIFAVLAALIISNQPRNVIGWLLMIPALGAAIVDPINLWVRSFETLSVDLMAVVEETIKPSSGELWIRQSTQGGQRHDPGVG